MSIQIQGLSGVQSDVDGSIYHALRVTLRPVDYGALGSYRISVLSVYGNGGPMPPNLPASSDVYQARWTSANYALIWGLQLEQVMSGSIGFSTGIVTFEAYISRSWTIDGTGTYTANLTGNNQKLRTSMASSSMGIIRSAYIGALGTGTKINDAQPLGSVVLVASSVNPYRNVTSVPGSLGAYPICLYGSMSLEDGGNPAPVVLAQNEGITVQATVPATGNWYFGTTMAWSEVASY